VGSIETEDSGGNASFGRMVAVSNRSRGRMVAVRSRSPRLGRVVTVSATVCKISVSFLWDLVFGDVMGREV
jgi:hypothetical protein